MWMRVVSAFHPFLPPAGDDSFRPIPDIGDLPTQVHFATIGGFCDDLSMDAIGRPFVNAMFFDEPAGTFADGYVFRTLPDLTSLQQNQQWLLALQHRRS